MTNVHRKASDEMKELQESVAAALIGFKSLQSYLAEPSMQVRMSTAFGFSFSHCFLSLHTLVFMHTAI
jgi:hypothetical protein